MDVTLDGYYEYSTALHSIGDKQAYEVYNYKAYFLPENCFSIYLFYINDIFSCIG